MTFWRRFLSALFLLSLSPSWAQTPGSLPTQTPGQETSPAVLRTAEPTQTAGLSESDSTPITLDPSFEISIPVLLHLADTQNIDVALAQNQITQAKWDMVGAFSKLLPSLDTYNYYENYKGDDIFIGPTPFPASRKTFQLKAAISYDIHTGGQDILEIRASQFAMGRNRKMSQEAYQEAVVDLLTQYNTYLRDLAAITVAQESLRQAKIQLRISESRYHAGFTTKLDVAQTEELVAQKEGDLVKAQNQKEATESGLGAMIKLPIGIPLKPQDSELKPIQLVDEHLKLPELFQTALANRADLKGLQDGIREAQLHYAASRSAFFPTLSFSAYKRGIGPESDMKPNADFMASVSMDGLQFMGVQTFAQMQQDKAKIEEATLKKQKQLFEIQKDLSEAYLNSSLAQSQIAIAEQKTRVTEEAYKIARHRRLSGAGINLEVIQAAKDLADAKQEYFSAVMNYNIAQLKLLLSIGQLTPQRILMRQAVASGS